MYILTLINNFNVHHKIHNERQHSTARLHNHRFLNIITLSHQPHQPTSPPLTHLSGGGHLRYKHLKTSPRVNRFAAVDRPVFA